MSGKMHQQTVDLVASENYSSVLKGTVNASSNDDRLAQGFPGSPILDGTYDPKKTFVNLVLKKKVFNPSGKPSPGTGHWGLTEEFTRDYDAPNLLEVEGAPNGGPSGPFTPNAASSSSEGISSGKGQDSVVNPAQDKASRAPYPGDNSDSEAAQPSTTSKIHRQTTIDMFKEDVPTGIMGSNSKPPPEGI